MGKSTPNWRTLRRFLGILAYKSGWLYCYRKKYASSRVLAYCGSFHHVTNVISKKNEARDQLVSPTKINKKKREGDHITETMGVAGRGR
jgi:hypothetical protein